MRSRSGTMFVAAVGVAVLLLGACSTKKTEPASSSQSLSVRAPADVAGNVVTLNLEASGITIVAADGDTSGKTGHYHVFIDREPVVAREIIPKEAGIVHSADPETKIMGLSSGEHVFTVVLGDGAHRRVGNAVAPATVKVGGPSVDASVPKTAKVGEAVPLTIKLDGATPIAAAGDTSGKTGHFHIFIDRDPILTGPIPKEAGIVHTVTPAYSVTGLAAGEHTIWVVFGNGIHESFADPVMDKVTVTVA